MRQSLSSSSCADDNNINKEKSSHEFTGASLVPDQDNAKDIVIQALEEILKKENISRSEAVKKVSKQLKAPRSIVYSIALKMEW